MYGHSLLRMTTSRSISNCFCSRSFTVDRMRCTAINLNKFYTNMYADSNILLSWTKQLAPLQYTQ